MADLPSPRRGGRLIVEEHRGRARQRQALAQTKEAGGRLAPNSSAYVVKLKFANCRRRGGGKKEKMSMRNFSE